MFKMMPQEHAEKVWKTLMSIEPSRQHGEKVREDLNRYRLKQDGQDLQDGQDEEAIAGDRPPRNGGARGTPSLP